MASVNKILFLSARVFLLAFALVPVVIDDHADKCLCLKEGRYEYDAMLYASVVVGCDRRR
tara:strand:- start:52 stop:231 length:180 start_codon:yes stop_codon:yes gene_type:complete